MAIVSEIPDGSDDGDDQNKKAKELDKKPKEVEKKLKEKVLYSLPIPDSLILSCFARVMRCYYPTISLVSSPFYQLITSPMINAERSYIGHTEHVLYAYVKFPPPENPSWYFLHRKPYRNLSNTLSLKLGKLDSLPPIPRGSAIVTVGSNIYLIGGCVVGDEATSNVTLIDCKSNTYLSLPSMCFVRCRAAAGFIDGNIYVIGGCRHASYTWVEVFDIKNKTWSLRRWPRPIPNLHPWAEFVTYVVMEEKIYMRNNYRTYAYNPKKGCANSWGISDSLNILWQETSCVIDDMLFILNLHESLMVHYPILVYEPKERAWKHFKGLEGFPANILVKESKMVNFGGKLMILGPGQSGISEYDGKKEIWCVEIVVERKQGGRIWGKIESVGVVLTPLSSPSVELCQTVMV